MRYDVISIGSATLDVFVEAKDLKLLETKKVFTNQALMIPYGAKCEVERLTVQSGGGGTNTAVGFSRLGLKAAVLARCGWDFAGKVVREELEEVIIARHHSTADNNRKLCKELGGILDKDKRCIVAETKVISFNYK